MPSFHLFPESASTISTQVDLLYFYLMAITALGVVIVTFLVTFFGIRYRKDRNPVATQIHGSVPVEILWTVVPLGLFLVAFVWGAALYYRIFTPPPNAMDIYVVGKQWMWKAEHPSGQHEINALHVPMNRPVRLILTSQDVFHSFSLPEFRVKREATPGKYNTVWFEATKKGTYHIFCSQYCGTLHSQMIGEVTVMEQAEYDKWLAETKGTSLAEGGKRLFLSYGCITCHRGDSGARGPNLFGLYGTAVTLGDQAKVTGTVTADEAYIRESILNPSAKIVMGYQNIMPTYQGQVSEDQMIQLVEYIKSLKSNDDLQTGHITNEVGQPPAHTDEPSVPGGK